MLSMLLQHCSNIFSKQFHIRRGVEIYWPSTHFGIIAGLCRIGVSVQSHQCQFSSVSVFQYYVSVLCRSVSAVSVLIFLWQLPLSSSYNWPAVNVNGSFRATNRSLAPNLRQMAKRNSRTDLGNVLLRPWKLDRMPQKHIQKLVNICGRASLSRNSLFGHIFIDI